MSQLARSAHILQAAAVGRPGTKLTVVGAVRRFSACTAARERSADKVGAAHGSSVLEPGQVVHGFAVESLQTVPELKLKAIRLRHERTGAEWLHIDRDDSNNVFSVGFGTSATDSTGVAHILEHTALCGSHKYPVRDPFFKMLNRSLSTFMNAWTAHDYTQYPFSTQNAQDYANLQQVYLDAAFNPLLREVDFRQEGWRLERKDDAWKMGGIVYNEMKGAFSDAGSLFATRAEQQMFPGTTYQYVSGGDPQFIPDLTHSQLKDFHATRYHPSNARIYSYGSFPLAPQLERVDRVISGYTRAQPVKATMEVEPFGTRQVTEFGPSESVGAADRQTKFSLSYLANDIRDVYTTFALSIFGGLLLHGPSAPMHQALLDTHLGADYSANTGYSPYTRQATLSVGLQGMADSDIPVAEQRISETLARVAEQGFERRRVDAALATVELAYKHKTANFGLSLMQSVSTGWFHGVDPVEYLQINKNIARLRADVERGGVFEDIVSKYFAQSQHQLKYVMLADPKYGQQLEQREHELVSSKVADLGTGGLAELDAKNEELEREQAKTEDLSSLPTLTLADVGEQGARYAVDMGVAGGCVPVQWRSTATNGISYMRVINDVRDKHPDLWPYMPLFCAALTYQGTPKRTMSDIETDIRLHTGGLSFAPFVTTDLTHLGHIEAGISFRSHCLDAHVPDMYRLVLELVRETDFDNVDRLRSLLSAMASDAFNDVADSGHAYVRRLAASTLTPEMQAKETLDGIAQVRFLGDLARQTDLSPVVAKLKQVQDVIFNRLTMRAAITTNVGGADANQRALEDLLASYPQYEASDKPSASENPEKFTQSAGRFFCPLPFATNFAGMATRCVPYTHPDSVSLQLLAKFLTPHFLHREIRERNGAYGGGAGYSALQGVFSFFSYRDPSPLATIHTFRNAVDWLMAHEISDREMAETKLSVFGDLDAPISAADEGMGYFTTGITDDMRQERRERFFAASKADIKDAAAKYLLAEEQTSVAVIGEEGLDMSGDWKHVRLQ
ncbi:Mitochondrial presequence protease [Coemansia sp. RSA 552]|nr:Mitochondrial presequence protease [Coemansia sp. RSA 552]